MKPYHVYIVSLKQTISCSPFPRKPAVKNAKQVIVRAWLRAWGASGDTSRRATKGMWYYARHPGSHARTLTCFALIVPSMFSRIRETTRSQPLSCIRLPGFHISKPSRNHSKWIKWLFDDRDALCSWARILHHTGKASIRSVIKYCFRLW